MLENQFIQFAASIPEGCEFPMLINKNQSESFYVPRSVGGNRIDLITPSGNVIERAVAQFEILNTGAGATSDYLLATPSLSSVDIANVDCFRYRLMGVFGAVDPMDEQTEIDVQANWVVKGIQILSKNNLLAGDYELTVHPFSIAAYMSAGGGRPIPANTIIGYMQVVNADGDVIASTTTGSLISATPSVEFTLHENTDIRVSIIVTRVDALEAPPNPRMGSVSIEIEGTLDLQSGDLDSIEVVGYSNLLMQAGAQNEYSMVRYRCNEDAFGFPFSLKFSNTSLTGAVEVQQLLPIRCYAPQYSQKDETYEKQDGEVVTLYAKYYREWSGVTEYLPASVHDKIMAALSCDELYINGVRVTKSDNYQIDWDNYDLDCDGVTKLARATFKVRESITQRNSNY